MEQQANQDHFSMLDRYIFGALPRSTKLRPLAPEFATFHYVVTPGQHLDRVAEVLRAFPKGAKLLSRKLWQWGEFRAEQFTGKCLFIDLVEEEIMPNDVVECHHVGVPH